MSPDSFVTYVPDRSTDGTRTLFKEGQDMAPRIDPRLRVGSRRAAPSVVHAVGMPVLDLSRGTVRDIDRVPGAFVAQMAERVGMTVLLQASNCDLGQNRRGPDLVVLARDQENRSMRSLHGNRCPLHGVHVTELREVARRLSDGRLGVVHRCRIVGGVVLLEIWQRLPARSPARRSIGRVVRLEGAVEDNATDDPTSVDYTKSP